MIANSTLYCVYLGVTLTFIGPMVMMLVGILFKKFRLAPIFMGMLMYFVSSYLIRLPILMGIDALGLYDAIQNNSLLFMLVSSFMIASTLGIGRAMGWLPLKKNHDFNGALSFGFGLGMMDCILMVGITMVSTMSMMKAYNAGTLNTMMAGLDSEYVATVVAALTSTSGYVYVISSIERVVFLLVEMVLAVFLYKAWQMHKGGQGTLIAIGTEWFLLVSASLLSMMNQFLSTAYLLLWAGVGMYFLRSMAIVEKSEVVNCEEKLENE